MTRHDLRIHSALMLTWVGVLIWACMGVALSASEVPKMARPMAEDPVLEARLIAISEELRCLVCQNESLASSHAELAQDLREEVRGLKIGRAHV